jgi:hypothetical protein
VGSLKSWCGTRNSESRAQRLIVLAGETVTDCQQQSIADYYRVRLPTPFKSLRLTESLASRGSLGRRSNETRTDFFDAAMELIRNDHCFGRRSVRQVSSRYLPRWKMDADRNGWQLIPSTQHSTSCCHRTTKRATTEIITRNTSHRPVADTRVVHTY